MKILKLILKILGVLIALFLTLAGGAWFALNSKSVQNRIIQEATQVLTEKLQTKVEIDSVHISFLDADLHFYGMRIDDRQQRRMLGMERVDVDMELIPLLYRKINLNEARFAGMRAHLTNDTINGANYQFVLDAFKKDTTKIKKQENDTIKKKKFELNLGNITIEDAELTYNQYQGTLKNLRIKGRRPGKRKISVEEIDAKWNSMSKNGEVSNHATIRMLSLQENGDEKIITTHSLKFANDNHKPRKNAGKPKKGFFDAQHLDITAQVKAKLRQQGKDTIIVDIDECKAFDEKTGIDIRKLKCNVEIINKEKARIKNFEVQQGELTTLKFNNALVNLPSKKAGRKLAFQTSTVTGQTQLKDISRAFAPVLQNFTTTINVQTVFSGNENILVFKNCIVGTPDKQLNITANGNIKGLKNSKALDVHFNVGSMYASVTMVQNIINQFPLKRKFMMKQLNALAYIKYIGDFHVIWKKELFNGNLNTKAGNVAFNLTIDNLSKYLYGRINTKDFLLGKVFDIPDIGRIVCSADFKFDISSQRTAAIRNGKKGKLPIGSVDAKIDEVSYKKVFVRDITGQIESDGQVANGSVMQKNMFVDLLCDFTFDNADEMRKMKIKPNLKMHKKYVGEDKLKRREEKKRQKELKKQQKAAEKEAKAKEKAAEKEAKAKEKAEKKAAKEAKEAAKQKEAAL